VRVLFFCCPELGHVHPLFPLARAAVDAGHEVRFGSGASVTDRIRRAGFAADDVGPPGMPEMFAALAERIGGEPGRGLAPEEILQWFFPNLFAATVAPLVIGDLLDLVDRWRPDLIVHDTAALAGPLAGAVAHVPSAQHSLGLLLPADVYRLGEQSIAPLWERHGLRVEPMGGSFRGPCLSIAPPDLETPVDDRFSHQIRRLRPVGFSATLDESLPGWVADLPARPTVYVTLGTFLNSDRSVFRAALDGLSQEQLNVVVTVGRNHSADWLDPVPPNARVEQYIPQSALLPHCDALVSHGGSGTLLPALGAGLPQVLVPQGADNFLNADRCEAAGAGLALRPGAVTPAAVLGAVRSVLDEPSYRNAARRLADQIADMPGPDEVLAGLAL
jgi:UDP:flavonoid glycosyltransferase YjiC (YdhE family)